MPQPIDRETLELICELTELARKAPRHHDATEVLSRAQKRMREAAAGTQLSEAMNRERMHRAQHVIERHADLAGNIDESQCTCLVDLLTDLRHWAARHAHRFDEALRLSLNHYEEERNDRYHE
jgi:hypothetical protein